MGTDAALCGLWFKGQRYEPEVDATWVWEQAALKPVVVQLEHYFAGHSTSFDCAVEPAGTLFQRSVWQCLRSIPAGQTWSYLQVAQALGRPQAVRAVGAAIGRNPISIIIPCHRVVGSSGSLTGYAGGLERKEWLLKREAAL
jgi:methylated-DNA-[protein]-cysteine S-methyltransferase